VSRERTDNLYRQAICDELLAEEMASGESDEDRILSDNLQESSNSGSGPDTLQEDGLALLVPRISQESLQAAKRRASLLRAIALVCTCSLSIGSH